MVIEAVRNRDFLELEPLYGGKGKRGKIKETIVNPDDTAEQIMVRIFYP